MDPEGQGPPFSVHGCLLGCYSGRPSPNTSYLLLYCILYFIHRILVRVSYECVFVSYMFVFRMSFNKYVRLLVQYVPKRTWEHETRSSIRVTRPAVFHPMHPPMSESPVQGGGLYYLWYLIVTYYLTLRVVAIEFLYGFQFLRNVQYEYVFWMLLRYKIKLTIGKVH